MIDADTHLTEAHDLWTSRAPAKFKDRVPHVEEIDGRPMWIVDGAELGFAGGGGVIDRDGDKGRALEALYEWTQDRIHLGAFDPKARIEVMDDSGIWAQVCFPNSIGLGGQGISDVVYGSRAAAALRADLQRRHRRDPGGVEQPAPPHAGAPGLGRQGLGEEAERVAGLGLRGVNLTSDTQDLGAPDLASLEWDPLWDVCADLHLPVHFHIGASLTTMTYFGTYPWESQNDDTKLAIGGTLAVHRQRPRRDQHHPQRHARPPSRRLQMVSVESGVGWIPFILEALDYEMSENAPKELDKLSMLPSEYFKRQLFATFWFEKNNVPALIESVGEDNVLFETDFPHPTCLYPKPLETVADKMSTLTPEVQRKILGENAAKLYRL